MSNIFFQAGLDKCKSGDYKSAIRSFDLSLGQDPEHLPSLYNRAKAHHKLGFFEEAIADFNAAIALEPSNADFWSDRGVAKHMLKQREAALKDLDKAAELEPSNPYRYSSRAFLKTNMGDLFGAKDDYLKAIDLDPEDAIAYNNLGLLEQQMGYADAAEKYFAKADNRKEGEPFEKPDLKKILAEHEAKKERSNKITLNVPETDKTKKVDGKDSTPKQTIWEITLSVFTSKGMFQEFMGFVKSGSWLKRQN